MSNEITDNSYQSTREIPQLFQNLLFIIDSFKLGFQRLPVAFGCPVSRVSLTLKMIIVTLSFIFLHASDLLKSSQLSCGKFHILNVFWLLSSVIRKSFKYGFFCYFCKSLSISSFQGVWILRTFWSDVPLADSEEIHGQESPEQCLPKLSEGHPHTPLVSQRISLILFLSFPHHHPTLSRDIQHRLANGNQTPFCLKFLQGQLHFKGVLQKPKVFTYMMPADSVSASLSTPAPTIPQPCLMHLPLAPQVGRTFSVSRLAVVCGFHLERLSLGPLHGMLLTKAQQVLAPRKPPGGPPCPQSKQAAPPPPPFQHVYLSLHLFPHLELSN